MTQQSQPKAVLANAILQNLDPNREAHIAPDHHLRNVIVAVTRIHPVNTQNPLISIERTQLVPAL